MSQQLRTRDEIGAYFLDALKVRDFGSGPSFPTAADGITLQAGDRRFRSDLGRACFYDGTRWLGDPYALPMHIYTAGIQPYTAAGNLQILAATPPPVFNLYVMDWRPLVYIGGTNNGSNYWTLSLKWYTNVGASSTVASFTTAGLAANAQVRPPALTLANQDIAAGGANVILVEAFKTGTPGSLIIANYVPVRDVIV